MYNVENKFSEILEHFCKVNGLNMENIIEFIKKKENRYLLILIVKKYGDINDEKIREVLGIKDRSLNIMLKKAEEKILINKEFRKKYFKLDEVINKII